VRKRLITDETDSRSSDLAQRSIFIRFIRFAIVAFLSSAIGVHAVAQQPQEKNVLVLYGALRSDPQFLDLVMPEIRARVPGPVTFYEEYLVNFPDDAFFKASQAETLRREYAGAMKPDLVLAVRPQAADFAVKYRDIMFPGVPIVYSSITSALSWPVSPRTTGVRFAVGVGETIDLALRLHPDTTTMAVISGPDWRFLDLIHSKLLPYKNKVKEIDLIADAGYREILAKAQALPSHTVVLFDLPPDPSRKEFGGWELLAAVGQRWPTYSPFEWICVNHDGCIGGVYGDDNMQAREAGIIAARVLLGENPDDIPVLKLPELETKLDWRQLRRWHVPESSIPAGSLVLFREPSPWEQGRRYFLAGIAVIAVQGVLIFALFWQRARRRKVEIELGKSEEKFSKAFRRSPLSITIVRATDDRYIEVNEIFEVNTGWMREEVLGQSPLEIGLWIDPDERAAFLRQLLEKGDVKDFEIRFRRKDGEVRTGRGSAELIELNGEQCALSVIADITERKQAEEAMASVSSRLIEAQEAERTRIARELHDDISQRLAMVSIILSSIKDDLPASAIETNRQVQEALAETNELQEDVQGLSHRLHSSRLELLGLQVAASGFCREMSERQNVRINFHYVDVPDGLSDQMSLCLFRVLQEALHNAVKYSGVDEFDVTFTGASGEIELRVHDSGAGFDPRKTSKGHGLGLISMQERLKLVRGVLSIDSKPGHGTTVLARVPLGSGNGEIGYLEEKLLDLTNQSVRIPIEEPGRLVE
jgi:PAS domain S-box-containing protein